MRVESVRLGRMLFAAGLLAAAFCFFCGAQQAKKNADAVRHNVTLFLKTPISAEDARMLCERQDDTAFTVWTQKSGQTVTDPDMGRRVRTDVLMFYGSPGLALPMAGGLSAGDTEGCLIGEQTAWKLFGSTGVVGDEICVGGETKTIRAVIRLPQAGVLTVGGIAGDGESGEADMHLRYDRITLSGTQAADAETFLMQNDLDAAVLRLDYLCGFGWLAELVPGKWSDFSGWKENLKQKEQDFVLLSAVSKKSPELYYERQCRRYWLNCCLGVICIVIAVKSAFRCAFRRHQRNLSSIQKWFSKYKSQFQ